MSKRSFTSLILILLLALSAGIAQAQAPFVSITSPASGTLITNLTAPLNVTVQFGNAPTAEEGGSGLLLRAYDDSEATVFAQNATTDVSLIPWQTSLDLTLTPPTPGTTGHLVAYMVDGVGNRIATSPAIAVTYGTASLPTPTNTPTIPTATPTSSGGQPSITLSSPTNGAVVDPIGGVSISGTVANMPGGGATLLVRLRNANGETLGEQGYTPNPSQPNQAWSVIVKKTLGSATTGNGTIIVFMYLNGGFVTQTDPLPVNFPGVQPTVTNTPSLARPFVRINSPLQGSVVGGINIPIQVFGVATNLNQNTVTVRALDPFGNVLAQQSTVFDPQSGNWQVPNLFVNVQPGTPGTLFAFGNNPQTGAVVGSTRVGVTFGGQCFIRTDWPVIVVQTGDTLLRIAQRVGSTVTELAYGNCLFNADLVYVGQQLRVPRLPVTPQPAQVTLRIITPVDGSPLDISQRITVAGAGLNIFGNNVVVRALDANGNLLAQQTVIGGPAGANGEGTWQTSLSVLTGGGARGAIYAFVQSPASGQVLADALVNVTFGTPAAAVAATPAPEKKLIITQPVADAAIAPSGPLQVTGQVIGPIDGDVFVRVLDNQGNVLGETQAQLAQPDAQGNSNWTATLNINVQPGTRGTIFAYVPSPFDVSAMIADSVNVSFGQAGTGPYVTITSPLPYSTLNISSPITVTGRGGRLFEGNVVVRALDAQGNVLTEQSTTLNAPNAGTGGEGDWQVSLQINVAQGTRGSIVAFSTSAQNGGIVAFASIYVTFGDPTTTDNFVKINAPLPGTLVDPSQTLMIAGTADRRNGNTVKVQIVDDKGNVLVEQPRNLNPSENGDFGVWQMLVELKSMAPGTHLRINALTTSKVDGTTLATDSIDIVVGVSAQAQGS